MANTETNQDKLKALQLTLDKIEKNFGKGSVMKLGDNVVEDVAVIPSGSIGLDRALGVGGYPKGRVIEIFGPESSGKTTLSMPSPRHKNKAVSRLSSMPNTLSIGHTQRNWELT